MSKYLNKLRLWWRGQPAQTERDPGVPALLDTYNRHPNNSAAQILAGTGIMH